jgi:hypothetical protein
MFEIKHILFNLGCFQGMIAWMFSLNFYRSFQRLYYLELL